MTSSDIGQEAVFIGANRQNYVSDYNPQTLTVAFGAANTVALWKPLDKDHRGVYFTLKKHTREVTGVKFLPDSPFLVSIGEDHYVNIWKQKEKVYEHFQQLEGHNCSVTCIAEINPNVFVTGGADGKIIIWLYDGQEFKLGQRFQVKPNFFPLSLAVQKIDDNESDCYILAVGGTATNIYIYTFQLSEDILVHNLCMSEELTGHEDWVKCLQFVVQVENKDYILASGSQDRYVRLWRLKLNDSIVDSDQDSTKLILLSNKQYKFKYGTNGRAAFSFEALIMGHDDWISGLQWHPSYKYGNDTLFVEKKLQLLTATADTALMIWEMDVNSGIWVCVSRLGEMSIKGASTATGATGGFWSCLWFTDQPNKYEYVLATGKTGSIRAYKSSLLESDKYFTEVMGTTGAVGPVTDVRWSLGGDYFMATSLDQTTRLYAPWIAETVTWHELARPQIHGYDMICCDNISSTKFVSGGDEKILRVFELTKFISESLKGISGIVINSDNSELPEFASLPVLGLSNKADTQVQEEAKNDDNDDDDNDNDNDDDNDDDGDDIEQEHHISVPPTESYLQKNSLATENQKLYGHGYEISCCSTSPNGQLIATACKSNNAKHAVIKIFVVSKDYQQSSQVLAGHNLTVSSLEFSPNGDYLLAVSRDRSFSLWKLENQDTAEFTLVQLNAKAHSRIIWDCSWLPETGYFVTASRDKQLKLWRINETVELVNKVKLNEPITSVSAFKGEIYNNKCIIAAGLENGEIVFFSASITDGDLKQKASIPNTLTPCDRIQKISFSNKLIDNKLYLAVGSRDTSTRLYSISNSIFR
ncbi:ELP2 [Candida oxycetoniae]|uniref:Elongator complex protein 2 n=1 Tax=Candida oxycetoniae TaxID=497107 RepID=A0AAI9STX4_9ASCO|nr:ELP2 [Candida oxycetoniae]KAI3402748.2 ELP2 [Candida oxycetoniae]